jgi:hypothetical protein
VPPPAEVVPPPAEVVPPPAEVVGNQDGDAFDDYVDLCPGTASGGNLDGDNDKIGNGCDSAPSTPATDTGADQMRVKTNGCKVNAVNRVDPIAYTQHLHRQFGNRSTTNESTGAQLKANASTSCDAESGWFTSAAWFPVEGNAAGTYQEDVLGISTYYRAPGNQAEVKPIPTGLQLLATEEKYNCTASGVGTFKETPPYGCYGAWTTRVIFPDCWNMASMEEDTMVYSGRRGVCPSTHPYRISQVSFLIRHANNDNFIPNPLMVSSGVDEWSAFTNMHADYFAALQDEFGRDTAAGGNLVDLCLRNANDGQDVAHPRCGEGP